jgi:hypothetical protein
MDSDHRALFLDLKKRPQAFGLDGTFRGAVAFINGYDAGNAWGLLIGFREWLALKLDCEANLVWWRLVLMLAAATRTDQGQPVKPDEVDDTTALEVLFNLLDEFLAVRNGPHGASIIIGRYLERRRYD